MNFLPNLLIIPVGLVIGVLVAMPVGPVNILCLQRALERGFWGGVAAGLGVGAVSGAIKHYRMTVQTVGGLVLLAFGLRLFLTPPRIARDEHADGQRPSLADFAWDIPQTFFLTITNPAAMLGLFAIFGGISSFVEVETYVDAFTIVAAIMAGSLAWWVVLSHTVGRFRHHMDLAKLQLVNRVAGIVLIGFSGLLLGEVAMKTLFRTPL